MLKYLILSTLFFFLFACSSKKVATTQQTKPQLSVDVQNWMNTVKKQDTGKLAIMVKTKKPLDEYKFLKKISENFYSGNVTSDQLHDLINDSRVLRIDSGKQKLH